MADEFAHSWTFEHNSTCFTLMLNRRKTHSLIRYTMTTDTMTRKTLSIDVFQQTKGNFWRRHHTLNKFSCPIRGGQVESADKRDKLVELQQGHNKQYQHWRWITTHTGSWNINLDSTLMYSGNNVQVGLSVMESKCVQVSHGLIYDRG